MLADELSDHGSDAILDTLALAYHRTGHTARAIENQKKAHALLPTGSEYRTAFERQLATFEKALKDARQDLPPEKGRGRGLVSCIAHAVARNRCGLVIS